jgi:hypothetical protein
MKLTKEDVLLRSRGGEKVRRLFIRRFNKLGCLTEAEKKTLAKKLEERGVKYWSALSPEDRGKPRQLWRGLLFYYDYMILTNPEALDLTRGKVRFWQGYN